MNPSNYTCPRCGRPDYHVHCPTGSSLLGSVVGVLLLAFFVAVGCGGMFLDVHEVDRTILRFEQRLLEGGR